MKFDIKTTDDDGIVTSISFDSDFEYEEGRFLIDKQVQGVTIIL